MENLDLPFPRPVVGLVEPRRESIFTNIFVCYQPWHYESLAGCFFVYLTGLWVNMFINR